MVFSRKMLADTRHEGPFDHVLTKNVPKKRRYGECCDERICGSTRAENDRGDKLSHEPGGATYECSQNLEGQVPEDFALRRREWVIFDRGDICISRFSHCLRNRPVFERNLHQE